MKFTRQWAMPNAATFTIDPIAVLLARIVGCGCGWIDPFSGQSALAEFRNDLNSALPAHTHFDARDWLRSLNGEYQGILFDPPYSPRQISEAYHNVGRPVGMEDTQNGALYSEVRDLAVPLIKTGGLAISFGWNSAGFGMGRGFDLEEVMLVCHGGAHNDTIVVVERKVQSSFRA